MPPELPSGLPPSSTSLRSGLLLGLSLVWFACTGGTAPAGASESPAEANNASSSEPASEPKRAPSRDSVFVRAAEYRRLAAELEPSVTPVLRELAQTVSGQLIGLEHRFKSQASLERKLKTKMVDENLAVIDVLIGDALRYTIQLEDRPVGHYTRSIRRTLSALERAGHSVIAVKNYWPRGDNYSGVNTVLMAPSGLRWEVQFHTADSSRLQKQSHPHYRQLRAPDTPLERKRELFREMAAPWDNVPIPAQVLDEKSLHDLEQIIHTSSP